MLEDTEFSDGTVLHSIPVRTVTDAPARPLTPISGSGPAAAKSSSRVRAVASGSWSAAARTSPSPRTAPDWPTNTVEDAGGWVQVVNGLDGTEHEYIITATENRFIAGVQFRGSGNGIFTSSVASRPNVFVTGDSIVIGAGATSHSDVDWWLLAERIGFLCCRAAASGERISEAAANDGTDQMATRIGWFTAISRTPDYVFLCHGVNDTDVTGSAFEGRYEDYIQAALDATSAGCPTSRGS